MIEPIKKTMEIFGDDRSAYTPNEVKILIELRDNMHLKNRQINEIIIACLIIVSCFFLYVIILLK